MMDKSQRVERVLNSDLYKAIQDLIKLRLSNLDSTKASDRKLFSFREVTLAGKKFFLSYWGSQEKKQWVARVSLSSTLDVNDDFPLEEYKDNSNIHELAHRILIFHTENVPEEGVSAGEFSSYVMVSNSSDTDLEGQGIGSILFGCSEEIARDLITQYPEVKIEENSLQFRGLPVVLVVSNFSLIKPNWTKKRAKDFGYTSDEEVLGRRSTWGDAFYRKILRKPSE